MAYEVTGRVFSTNTTPTDQTNTTLASKSYMLQLKNFLVANAGWTVVLSSNTTVANSSDNWNSLTDLTGNATPGNAHSWIVLKSPEGIVAGASGSYTGDQSRIWMLWDLNVSSTPTNINLYFDRVAYTGGSTTARPTGSADEIRIGGTNISIHPSSVTAGVKFNFQCEPNGSFTSRIAYNGSGVICNSLTVQKLKDLPTSSSLDYPYGIVFKQISNTSQTLEIDTLANIASTTNWYCWGYDGTVCSAIAEWLRNINVGSIGINTGNTGNDFNSLNESSPIWMYCNTATKYSLIGRIPDLYVTGAAITNATINNATVEFCCVAGFWIPFDTTVSL